MATPMVLWSLPHPPFGVSHEKPRCVYVSMCACACVCAGAYKCMFVHVCICASMHACMYVRVCICVCTHVYVHVCVCACMCVHLSVNECMWVHVRARVSFVLLLTTELSLLCSSIWLVLSLGRFSASPPWSSLYVCFFCQVL